MPIETDGFAYRFLYEADVGIRDYKVTGVQTCALPIFPHERFGGVEAAAKAQQPHREYSILAPVALPESGPALARVAASILGAKDGQPAQGKLYALDRKSVV